MKMSLAPTRLNKELRDYKNQKDTDRIKILN